MKRKRKHPPQSHKTVRRKFSDDDEDISDEIGQPDPDVSLRQGPGGK